MIKIRLMRIGATKRPFYRVVAVDERNKRSGEYKELLGTYNPLTIPHEVKLNQERIDYWIKQGAQRSEGFLRIIGQAPQHPPRPPKKQKEGKTPAPKPTSETKSTPSETANDQIPAQSDASETPEKLQEINPSES